MIAITAPRFTRIVQALVESLVRVAVGTEWSVMIGETADVAVWMPRAGTLVLQLVDEQGRVVRTATVCPGRERAFDIISGDALVIGETRGAEAAFSIALDEVTAPLRAATQHDHDPVSV